MKQLNYSGPVIFGEVLFDCFADGSRVLGGAPFNVAWHSQAFGLRPLFISRVGNDSLGEEVKAAMLNWGMETGGLQIDPAYATGMVDVNIQNGEPSYTIVENSAWDFIDYKKFPDIDKQSMLYHGSLALRNNISASSLAYLKQHCVEKIFVDVNLRPPWWNQSLIENVTQNSHYLKLNIAELALIVPQEKDTEARMRYLLTHFHIQLIVVTKGEDGAIAATQNEWCSIRPNASSHVIDTVGAGDAFSSVLLLGLHKGWQLQEILNRAQQFASAVVGQRGATTQNKRFYQAFISDWDL
jgi:fructokinase